MAATSRHHLAVKDGPDKIGRLRGTIEDVGVPEAEKAEALAPEISVADRIAATLGMLGAVRFDDKSCRVADEICNIVIDWLLPPKLETDEPTIPKQGPEFALGLRRFATHGPRISF